MENEMNLPVKNKESLEQKDTLLVSKLKYRVALWTAILSFAGLVVTSLIPLGKEIFINEEKQRLRKFQEEQRYQKFVDSIQSIQDKRTQDETYRKMSILHEKIDNMRKELPNSSAISIYFTHDSGGVPVSGSQLNVTILYTANNIEPCLGKSYWQDEPIPVGYFNYNYRLYQNKFIYIPDITKEPDIYLDETKEDIDCNNLKSVMGIVLKETPFGTYFLSVGWNGENTDSKNPNSRIIIRKYASEFEQLIEGKKRK